MSGYRQHSFDPNAYEQPGPPLKPYNWVQWTGVAIAVVGAALITLDLLGRFGIVPRWIEDTSPAPFMLLVVAMFLINSRRGPARQVGSEQLGKNRRLLIFAVAISAAIIGTALVVASQGTGQ